MNNFIEKNICAFCRQSKPVARQYLHAKNKPETGDGFDFIYYCSDCGLAESFMDATALQEAVEIGEGLRKKCEEVSAFCEDNGCLVGERNQAITEYQQSLQQKRKEI